MVVSTIQHSTSIHPANVSISQSYGQNPASPEPTGVWWLNRPSWSSTSIQKSDMVHSAPAWLVNRRSLEMNGRKWKEMPSQSLISDPVVCQPGFDLERRLVFSQPFSHWPWPVCLYSSRLGHTRRPTLCLRQQANNVTHRQRVPADQVSWWTPGATLCRGRFGHLASQDQHTLDEECLNLIDNALLTCVTAYDKMQWQMQSYLFIFIFSVLACWLVRRKSCLALPWSFLMIEDRMSPTPTPRHSICFGNLRIEHIRPLMHQSTAWYHPSCVF